MYGNNYSMFLINPFIYGAPISFSNLKSVSFDGIDEYADLGRVTATEGASNMTFSFWIKFDATVVGSEYPFGRYTTTNSLYCGFDVGTRRITLTNNTGGSSISYISLTNSLTLGAWYHIVWVFDGSLAAAARIKLYVDSVLNGAIAPAATPSTFNTATTDFAIGGLGGAFVTTYNFNGNIDEFALFDYSLTQTEVTAIFNNSVPTDLMELASPPKHYYRMGDDALDVYPTIKDIGATGGNDGTMTNMESGDITTDVP